MRASSKIMPKKDSPLLVGEGGTKPVNIRLPSLSKYSSSVLGPRLPGARTSVKITPKPVTVAGAAGLGPGTGLAPGTKNKPSVILLPTGVNRRDGLKVLKTEP